MDESLQKLNKYCETLNSKKQTNERSGGSNLLKMGTLMQRDLVTPRLEDRTKNVVLNKRIRSSIAEIRVCIQCFFENFIMFFCKQDFISNPCKLSLHVCGFSVTFESHLSGYLFVFLFLLHII